MEAARWLSVLESDGRHFEIPQGRRAAVLEIRRQWSDADWAHFPSTLNTTADVQHSCPPLPRLCEGEG